MPLSTPLQLLTLTLGLLSQLSPSTEPLRATGRSLQGLAELSGLTITQQSAGSDERVMWGHNDSGNRAEVIAMNDHGERLLTVELGVEVNDLEDIDAAPCPSALGEGRCLWLADVGDNHGARAQVQLLIFPVPALPTSSGERLLRLSPDQLLRVPFSYPEGVRPNVEAMTVSQAGEVWLFEKSDEAQIRVWSGLLSGDRTQTRLELQSPERLSLRRATRQQGRAARLMRVTGADLSEDGMTLALRTYGSVYLFNSSRPLSLPQLTRLSPRSLEISQRLEPQGESVALDLEHDGLWTASEQKGGCEQRLLFTSLHGEPS